MPVSILLVDDEENIRRSLRRVLRKENCLFTEAADGVEAAQILAWDFFDLMITDNDMPRKTGLELICDITFGKILIKNPALAIVLLSGRNKPSNLPVGIEFLSKPWEDEILKEKVWQIRAKRKV